MSLSEAEELYQNSNRELCILLHLRFAYLQDYGILTVPWH